MRRFVSGFLLCCCLSFPATGAPPVVVASPGSLARQWLVSLTPQQHSRANLPFGSSNRRFWEYRPMQRRGLPLRSMNAAQRIGAQALWSSALTAGGLRDIAGVRRHEAALRRSEGAWRDPDLYYLTIFGTPKPGAQWGWRLEGHHLSLNFTYLGDRVVSSTPYFVGGPPAQLSRDGSGTTQKDALARRLVATLDRTQRAGIEGTSVPGDIVQQRGVSVWPASVTWGISGAALRSDQQALLMQLINAFGSGAGKTLVTTDNLQHVRFAWRGPRGGVSHYYRIVGRGFSLEYRNLDRHTHAIWRTPSRDFGVAK